MNDIINSVVEGFPLPSVAVHSLLRKGVTFMELVIAFTVALIALIIVAKNSRRSGKK